jgi:hypothetical protein
LNGRVDAKQLANFNRARRREFADRIAAVPADLDLSCMNEGELDAVTDACCFGFGGAWAPKITKLGALYRPRAIPILDGYIGLAFGYRRGDLSVKVQRFGLDRRQRIAAIVRALASWLRNKRASMALLRTGVSETVPELAETEGDNGASLFSDLRLLDIVIWTTMDDRQAMRAGRQPNWLGQPVGDHIPLTAVAPEPIRPSFKRAPR